AHLPPIVQHTEPDLGRLLAARIDQHQIGNVMAVSCWRIPPGSAMPRGFTCRVAIATPCTTARSAFGTMRSTSPRRPLLTPVITTTVSPLRMRAAIIVSPTRGTSKHLGRQRHDLGEPARPELAYHRAED